MHRQPFVPATVDAASFEDVRPLLEDLAGRAPADAQALHHLLLDLDELNTLANEEAVRCHLALMEDTASEEARDRMARLTAWWSGELAPLLDRCTRTLLDHPDVDALPDELRMVVAHARDDRRTYHPDHAELTPRHNAARTEVQKILGSQTVEDGGRQVPVQAAERLARQDPDRDRREQGWRAAADRRAEDADRLDALFGELGALAHQQATLAGFDGYVDYAVTARHQDWNADAGLVYADAVEEVVMPRVRRLHRELAADLGVDRLRPWDRSAKPAAAPRQPFASTDAMIEAAGALFAHVHPSLGEGFETLRAAGHLDLEPRKGKMPGAFLVSRPSGAMPSLFMSAVGTHEDLVTLLHEGGHALHTLHSRAQRMMANRRSPQAFNEVGSTSMEFLGGLYLDPVVYDPAQARAVFRDHLGRFMQSFVVLARLEAFEQWVHRNPGHTVAARHDAWLEVSRRFDGDTDWSGLEDTRALGWQRVGQMFLRPFSNLQYAYAGLGALQVWNRYADDPEAAIASLQAAWRLGGSRPAPELFAEAGLAFDISAAALERALAGLDAVLWDA